MSRRGDPFALDARLRPRGTTGPVPLASGRRRCCLPGPAPRTTGPLGPVPVGPVFLTPALRTLRPMNPGPLSEPGPRPSSALSRRWSTVKRTWTTLLLFTAQRCPRRRVLAHTPVVAVVETPGTRSGVGFIGLRCGAGSGAGRAPVWEGPGAGWSQGGATSGSGAGVLRAGVASVYGEEGAGAGSGAGGSRGGGCVGLWCGVIPGWGTSRSGAGDSQAGVRRVPVRGPSPGWDSGAESVQ